MGEAGTAKFGSFCRRADATSLSLGCLLDFLKTDEGSRLSLPRLIDMSAQVCELPRAAAPESRDAPKDLGPKALSSVPYGLTKSAI